MLGSFQGSQSVIIGVVRFVEYQQGLRWVLVQATPQRRHRRNYKTLLSGVPLGLFNSDLQPGQR